MHQHPIVVIVDLSFIDTPQFRNLVLEEVWRARDQVVVHMRADQTDDRAVLIEEDEHRRAQLRTCSPWWREDGVPMLLVQSSGASLVP